MSKHARVPSRTPRRVAIAATVGLLTFAAGWAYALQDGGVPTAAVRASGDAGVPSDGRAPAEGRADRSTDRDPGAAAAAAGLRELPGLSAATRARIPADSRQVILVAGKAKDSSEGTATLYTRPDTTAPWTAAGSWPARNGAKGWATDRRYGDLSSPAGVFSLTDAGGLLPPPPGTRLPYDRDGSFVPSGRGVNGESLAGSFDYVVAIDFNRKRGASPLDPTKPEGEAKGGNIWLHVDHNGPSQGCVGIPKAAMQKVLQTLDPAAKPVIVMGPAGF
ncbi:hypothetical protein DEJ50_13955 [Streptomyces venezuelae]|uniref:YkuD domain-containing protein n=1 Tax=Streptomyces venezuelae TaxID=54571 RepID=A0A5P2D6J4_STRVZ|nr:hypothetical protein [Streptomyces venezuelae]QES48759.1 hypothetical protein DEJ50_13955 [Streptomyces venezuelae]